LTAYGLRLAELSSVPGVKEHTLSITGFPAARARLSEYYYSVRVMMLITTIGSTVSDDGTTFSRGVA
jgi:hypothetical protein